MLGPEMIMHYPRWNVQGKVTLRPDLDISQTVWLRGEKQKKARTFQPVLILTASSLTILEMPPVTVIFGCLPAARIQLKNYI